MVVSALIGLYLLIIAENPNRPPPHLRGRDIGMWYARRSQGRKGLSGAAGAALAAREPARILTKADKAYIKQHSHVSHFIDSGDCYL